MTLFLNNDHISEVLTVKDTIDALEQAYRDLAEGTAICRARIDMRIPTDDPAKLYQWGTMEGGSSTSGYFAIRMKSDVTYDLEYEGTKTQEKYCIEPGTFCGLIMLMNIQNGEPLAFINDGVLQHMRVAADSGIGTKYMAREDAEVVGMIGSGGMARSHAESLSYVRNIKRINVFSPTKANRETYAKEMSAKLGIEVVAVASAEAAHDGADIIAGCTDSTSPVIFGRWIPDGAHVTCIGGKLDGDAMERIDRSLRLGSSPLPVGVPEFPQHDEAFGYLAKPADGNPRSLRESAVTRAHGIQAEGRTVFMEKLLSGEALGREHGAQVTFSERGNVQGLQFFAVAGRAYELAKAKGLGNSVPTEWLTQNIRD
ncbi:MAG: ornithine cyclodeaminase family protein [Chloroflexi bacterium]|nr:ornithine cyclodeaminase family protein [Chloroflexota bacterium]